MNKYRTHKCNELRKSDVDKSVSLSGWINKKRDHGNLLFIDLRDNYGITQCIIDKENKNFSELEKTQLETVIKVNGKVVNRSHETKNKDIETGEIEVVISEYETYKIKMKDYPFNSEKMCEDFLDLFNDLVNNKSSNQFIKLNWFSYVFLMKNKLLKFVRRAIFINLKNIIK